MKTSANRIPLAAKLVFTAFMAVLVPTYWVNYGPTNFLYFCDIALFLTLVGMWTEKPLPIGMAAAGIVLPQLLWLVDFACELLGVPLVGMTAYMFEEQNPLFNRSLSLFHGWLPLLLLWLVARVGYDRRSMLAWVATAWVLILVCYLWMPPPPEPGAVVDPNQPVNINYVYGLDGRQTWMPELMWLAVWMLAQPLVLVGPTHLLLRRFVRAPAA
ncbi:MAG: hypothetical protein KAI24_09620 [Planctomycetes bacterium]|nr:hypothetical protein [Planctomycetota bacterium]